MREKFFLLLVGLLLPFQIFAFPEIPLDFLKIAPVGKGTLFSLLESRSLLTFSSSSALFEGVKWKASETDFQSGQFGILFQNEQKIEGGGKIGFEGFYHTISTFQEWGSLLRWHFEIFDLLNLYGTKESLLAGEMAFAFSYKKELVDLWREQKKKTVLLMDRQLSIAQEMEQLTGEFQLKWRWGRFLTAIELCENGIYPVGFSQINLFYGKWNFSADGENHHQIGLLLGEKGVNPYFQNQFGSFQKARLDLFLQAFWALNEIYRVRLDYSHRTETQPLKIGTYLPFQNRVDLSLSYAGSIVDLKWILRMEEKGNSKGKKDYSFVERLESSYRFSSESGDRFVLHVDHWLKTTLAKKNLSGQLKMEWESEFKRMALRIGASAFFQWKQNPLDFSENNRAGSDWKMKFLADFVAQLPFGEGKFHLAFHLGSHTKESFDSDGQELRNQLDRLRWGKGTISSAIYYKQAF